MNVTSFFPALFRRLSPHGSRERALTMEERRLLIREASDRLSKMVLAIEEIRTNDMLRLNLEVPVQAIFQK